MRLGIFGGTFDPVHYGHLLLAECCREGCALDRMWFVPAAVAPHKQGKEHSPAEHRVAMLKLAIGGHEAFEVCTREVDRGGVNFTFETLDAIHAERPSDELFLLLGGDSLADLPTWREPARILELATPIVVGRPGAPPPDFSSLGNFVSADRVAEISEHFVTMPQIGISGTDLRRRVGNGRSIRYQTPRAVEMYICEQGLYLS